MSKIALIGFGKRGKTHLRNLKNISGVEVVAICDTQNLKSQINSIQYFKHYEKMLKQISIDAVIISVPTVMHYEIAKKCIENRKHVLIEKPITIDSKEAADLMKTAKRFNVACMVGYHLRFDKKINKIKSIIKSGKLGKILMIKGRQAHNWGGSKPFSWVLDAKQSGGGTIIDNATHYLDLFRYLIGEISEVHSFVNNLAFNQKVEDSAIISLKFSSGIIGSIETSWSDASGRNNQLTIWGTRAVLEYVESNEGEYLRIREYRPDTDEYNLMVIEQIYLPKGIEQITKKTNIDNTNLLSNESALNMLSCFIELIQKPNMIKSFLKSSNPQKNVQLVAAVYESIKENKVIKI